MAASRKLAEVKVHSPKAAAYDLFIDVEGCISEVADNL